MSDVSKFLQSESIRRKRLRKRNRNSMWKRSWPTPRKVSGVYIVFTDNFFDWDAEKYETKVWYVGSSGDIWRRISSPKHPYSKLSALGYNVLISYHEMTNEADYKLLEKRVIKMLHPPLNKQFNTITIPEVQKCKSIF